MKNRIIRIIAAAAAVCVAASMLAGCSKNKAESETTTTASSSSVAEEDVTVATQRPVAEGDIYAINKFKVKDLPDNYEFTQKSQADFDQHFRYVIDEGRAQMVVYAANYAEDYGPLEDLAGRVRFGMNFNNVMHHCDTEFSEAKKVSIAGFDGEYCDYKITQNTFETDENGEVIKDEDGKDIKTPIAWYKGRLYFFYSEKDAFYFSVESTEDYWETALKDFEENIFPNIYIDENAENDPIEETTGTETAAAETTSVSQ